MNFVSPYIFFAFIPLSAAIIVLYLLKLKRTERRISSVFLWQEATSDIQANAPFQKLKKNLLLALQLIILLTLVFAAARPYIKTYSKTNNKIIVIIDASASMKSTDVTPSRFDNAKLQASGLVERIGPGDKVLIMSSSSKIKVASQFTSDKKALLKAINALQSTDGTCNMRQALIMAVSLLQTENAKSSRIVMISDGGIGKVSDIDIGNIKCDFVQLGRRCDNVGIVGMDSRKTANEKSQVFVGIKNFSNEIKIFDLEIYLDDKLIDIREERLKPYGSQQEIVEDIPEIGGRISALINVKDDLKSDNAATIYLSKNKKIDVLLVSKGNVFLQNAVNIMQNTNVTLTDKVPNLEDLAKFNIVIFDSMKLPPSLPEGNYLLVNSQNADSPAVFGKRIKLPQIADFKKSSIIMASVDMTDVKIAKSYDLKIKDWGDALLESTQGTIAAIGRNNGKSIIQIGFNILESDFPLHVGFPIFISNCIEWFAPYSEIGKQCVSTGKPIYLSLPSKVKKLSVVDPGGNETTITNIDSQAVFENTDNAGIYKIKFEDGESEFACNIFSDTESNTLPKKDILIGSSKIKRDSKIMITNAEVYGFCIIIVLCILMFEWYAYHRRL